MGIDHGAVHGNGPDTFVVDGAPGDKIGSAANIEHGQFLGIDLETAQGIIDDLFHGHLDIGSEHLVFQRQQPLPSKIDGERVIAALVGQKGDIKNRSLAKVSPPPIMIRVLLPPSFLAFR